MRVSLLIAADGTVNFVSDDAARLDASLHVGAAFDALELLRPLQPALDEARAQGHADRSVQLGDQRFEVHCDRAGERGIFVTLVHAEESETPTLGDLELVDVVLSGQPLPRILDELCRVAGSLTGARCAVLLLGEDGLLHFGGGPKVPQLVRDLCQNLAPATGRGACAEAAAVKRPIFSPDLVTDPQFAPFAEVLRGAPVKSCWAWPIVTFADEVLGSFVGFGSAVGLPNDVQAGVMSTLVRFVALAIEHNRNERATREMLDRYHLATEASTNVIYDWSLRNNRLEWSPRMRQVFGYDETQALSFDWWESCVHPADRERVVGSLQDAIIERRRTWNETYRFKRRSGTWATVVDRGHLLFDEAGSPARLIGELSDVSGQMQLQARLALTERLATVGTLAAGVAHEINNPLAWITSNLHYVIEELNRAALPGNDDVMAALNDARSGADRVSTIVRDLKMFARAQDEQTSLVDVRRVLESSITMVRNEIRHRASLERRFEEVPLVRGNEGKLSQVFLNLLINAAHALPEGDVANQSIVVSTSVDPRGNVLVQVRDTGRGIPPEVLPKIFDPFFTTKPVGQGTGLGLAICHSIVSGLGGSIQVESVPGWGTTFRVALPAASPELRKTPTPTFDPLMNRSARGLVALIDDEPAVLMALQRVLGPHHEVKSFTEPRVALDMLPALRPDVIFCDVMMPEMSGAEVYNRLRASHPTLADRLVFMTGGAFSPSAREFLDDVQRPILDKPFTAEAVRRLANERVALSRSSR